MKRRSIKSLPTLHRCSRLRIMITPSPIDSWECIPEITNTLYDHFTTYTLHTNQWFISQYGLRSYLSAVKLHGDYVPPVLFGQLWDTIREAVKIDLKKLSLWSKCDAILTKMLHFSVMVLDMRYDHGIHVWCKMLHICDPSHRNLPLVGSYMFLFSQFTILN